MPAAPAPRVRPALRWDRLSRIALGALLLFIVFLALRPVGSYYGSWQEAEAKRTDVAKLRAENDALRRKRDALSGTSALEREARRLGMVKPGERAYSVRNLPSGR